MAMLLSVNRARPRRIPGHKALTGICKEPVAGPVAIGPQGLEDDAILDRQHHGGSEQAVYIYFQEDYDWWAGELAAPPAPGLFGENLTISGASSATAAIGDRFAIGEVMLEVTAHRTPCATFSARMGDPQWAKRFYRANRPGAYCRVIRPGEAEAGMTVAITPFAGERITMAELMAQDGLKDIPRDFMRRALTTPIREKTRFKYETKLASLF